MIRDALFTVTLLGVAGGVLPLAAAVRVGWRRLPPPLRAIALALAVRVAGGVLGIAAHASVGAATAHRLDYFVIPVETALFLWGFAWWQRTERARAVVRLAILLVVVLWAAAPMAGLDDPAGYSRLVRPLRGLLLMGVAGWTLLQSARTSTMPASRQPWLWASAAALLLFGARAGLGPVAGALSPHSQDEVLLAFAGAGLLALVAHLLFTWSILCWRTPHRSSGAFSLPDSRSSSWPRPSSPRSFSSSGDSSERRGR